MVLPWLMAINFMNLKYYHIPCSDNVPAPATVRNGKFTHTDRREAAEFAVYVTSVKEGSLHAGTRQAVVTLACDFPVGGTSAAYLYNVHGDAATFVAKAGEQIGVAIGAPAQARFVFALRSVSCTLIHAATMTARPKSCEPTHIAAAESEKSLR